MLRPFAALVLAGFALTGCGAVEASTPRANLATPNLPCSLPYGTHVALISPAPGSSDVRAGNAPVLVVASHDLPKTVAVVATDAKGAAAPPPPSSAHPPRRTRRALRFRIPSTTGPGWRCTRTGTTRSPLTTSPKTGARPTRSWPGTPVSPLEAGGYLFGLSHSGRSRAISSRTIAEGVLRQWHVTGPAEHPASECWATA
jgi:hypothetical protein